MILPVAIVFKKGYLSVMVAWPAEWSLSLLSRNEESS